MNLSDKINILMKRNHIKNSKELAENLSKNNLTIPYTTLLTIINNEVQDIKLGTAKKLCEYFNISLDELLDDNIELNNSIDFRFASFEGLDTEGLDDKDMEEINRFIEFVKNKKKDNK